MALIDLIDVHKHYDAQKILQGINFHVDEGERIVIVGKNGSGKSTIMKIVQGLIDFDEGERIMRQGLEVKMLAQVPKFNPEHTVREAVEAGLEELYQAKIDYDKLSLKLADDFENQRLLDEHARVQNYLDHHNAWNLDDKIERIMIHFKLKEYETKNIELLSGGEQRRVALAALLLQKPDILLLDEPTNHLDVYMVEFLEELILKEKFTMVFISHDRYFIDQVATKTVEIEDGNIREYRGGYSDYLAQKQEWLRTLQKQHDNLLRQLKGENEWFARGVRARLKRNEGRKSRLMDLRETAKTNPAQIRKMSVEIEREVQAFNRSKSVNKQKMLFEVENLYLQMGDKKLIENFNTRILQKDVIAIVGPNGTGKSTLLKVLLGRIKPTSGVINQGEFKIGYFDQHREMLDDDRNLIETFCPHGGDRVEVRGTNMHVYGYLKNFLFPREFLNKKIGVLSGGEKNRVALALLFTKHVDCMILDEPTNDLDIPTINILEEQLQNFAGAVILVSHDRFFVDKIAKKLFIIQEDRTIEESFQDYSEYLDYEKEMKALSEMEQEFARSVKKVFTPEDALQAIELATSKEPKPKQKIVKLSYEEKKSLETLPKEIESLEEKIESLQNCLADPKCYEDKGLTAIAKEQEEMEVLYEQKVEQLLEIEEKVELIANQ